MCIRESIEQIKITQKSFTIKKKRKMKKKTKQKEYKVFYGENIKVTNILSLSLLFICFILFYYSLMNELNEEK